MKLYKFIAHILNQLRCVRQSRLTSGAHTEEGAEVAARYGRLEVDIAKFVLEEFPSGSGFDAGTTLDLTVSTPNKLAFMTSFHHMEEGTYTGWTKHEVIVTPDLAFDFRVRVTGRETRRGAAPVKDYIAETFHDILDKDEDWEKVWRDCKAT